MSAAPSPTDLHVVALIPAKPGSEDVVRAALQTLVAATREEEGCISYDLYDSAATPGTFVTVERWRGQADLDTHLQTPHLQAALAEAGDAMSAAPAIHPLTPVDA